MLNASLSAGLSSPGRLHDLLVTCEGITPGEARALGAGVRIRHGERDTALGRAFVGITERGVCHLRFVDGRSDPVAELQREWPAATMAPRASATEVSAGSDWMSTRGVMISRTRVSSRKAMLRIIFPSSASRIPSRSPTSKKASTCSSCSSSSSPLVRGRPVRDRSEASGTTTGNSRKRRSGRSC